MKLTDAIVPNASVTWVNEIEAVPASTTTNGNVTINNTGSEGRVGHFKVSCTISANFENEHSEGVSSNIYIAPTIAVAGMTKVDSVFDIEDKGLRALAQMLRDVADNIDQQTLSWDRPDAAATVPEES